MWTIWTFFFVFLESQYMNMLHKCLELVWEEVTNWATLTGVTRSQAAEADINIYIFFTWAHYWRGLKTLSCACACVFVCVCARHGEGGTRQSERIAGLPALGFVWTTRPSGSSNLWNVRHFSGASGENNQGALSPNPTRLPDNPCGLY